MSNNSSKCERTGGSNSSLVYQVLLEHNAKVYITTRSKEKAEKAITSLKDATGKDAYFIALDLSDLSSVKEAASEFLSKECELHILFNNAYIRPIARSSYAYVDHDTLLGVSCHLQ